MQVCFCLVPQILNDNAGVGLMFETEGDTLAQTFKSEHGNYSDGFRKAFHHEKISYLRRKDREYITLEIPKLSALLSGTRQVQSLIPDAENGLFGRFMFYCMNIRLQWIDVLRIMDNGNINTAIVCSDTDFQISMEILKVLLQHATFVFRQLPQAVTTAEKRNNPKMALFQALSPQFDRIKCIEVCHTTANPRKHRRQANSTVFECRTYNQTTHGSYVKKTG
jgi:hypothetical protein